MLRQFDERRLYYEYRFLQAQKIALFLQRCGFAFNKIEAPISYEAVSKFLKALVNITVMLPGVTFEFKFIATFLIVVFFMGIFLVQESVEFSRFMYPSNKRYRVIWNIMSVYCELCSGFLAIPVMTYLLKIFKCQADAAGVSVLSATIKEEEDEDDGLLSGENSRPIQTTNSTDEEAAKIDLSLGLSTADQEIMKCWESPHLIYAALGILALVAYVPMAIRFIRVDRKLDCIEAKRNFFDWKSDTVALNLRSHANSLVNTTAERASFIVGVSLTFVSTFVESKLAGLLINFLVQVRFLSLSFTTA